MNQGLRQTIILGLTKISVISYSYSVFVVDTDSAVQLSHKSTDTIKRKCAMITNLQYHIMGLWCTDYWCFCLILYVDLTHNGRYILIFLRSM